MVYTIEFISVNDSYILAFESEEEKLKVFMSSKFINILKLLSSGNEASQDDVFYLKVTELWKTTIVIFLKQYADCWKKINELIAFMNKLSIGDCLAVLFNYKLDILDRNKILCDLKGEQNNIAPSSLYEEFIEQYGELLQEYRTLSYECEELFRVGTQERKERKCRYCGKSMPEVTFKKNAHAISQALGNYKLFTNDECDTCNDQFGHSEDEFIKYISIYRTIASTELESMVKHSAEFSSFKLSAKENDSRLTLSSTKISKIIKTDEKLTVYHEAGKLNFLEIYKTLVKFVIGLLPDEELIYFERTKKWLLNECQLKLYNFKRTIFHEPEEHPFINIYFRKNETKELPYLVAELHVFHLEFLYVIPGCIKDNANYDCNIIDKFISIKHDSNIWETVNMQNNYQKDMIFKCSIPLDPKKQ